MSLSNLALRVSKVSLMRRMLRCLLSQLFRLRMSRLQPQRKLQLLRSKLRPRRLLQLTIKNLLQQKSKLRLPLPQLRQLQPKLLLLSNPNKLHQSLKSFPKLPRTLLMMTFRVPS